MIKGVKIRIAHQEKILLLHVEGGPVLATHVPVLQAGVLGRVKQGTLKGVIDLTKAEGITPEILSTIMAIRLPAALLGSHLSIAFPDGGDAPNVEACIALLSLPEELQKLLVPALEARSKELTELIAREEKKLEDMKSVLSEGARYLRENVALEPLANSLGAMIGLFQLKPEPNPESPAPHQDVRELLDTMDEMLSKEGLILRS